MKKRNSGFTLIELLIVVAIIAILAAIAIPNYLEAQVRAKVARNQADYKVIQTGMMVYYTDQNNWPSSENGAGGDHSTLMNLFELTTPIAYITTVPYQDPFSTTQKYIGGSGERVSNHYQYWHWPSMSGKPVSWGNKNQVRFTKWLVFNCGPWQSWPSGFDLSITYDSSNGTVSPGILWVSEIGIFGK